jgi:hypothetical protein
MYTGPNLKKDALVFGYDTGEFSSDNPNHAIFKPVHSNNRHFKGSASRNHIAGQNAVRKFPLEPLTFTTSGSFAAKHPNDIKAYDVNGNRLQTYVNQGVGNWTNTHHAHWQHDRVLNKPVVVMEDLDAQWKAKSFGTGLGTWNSLGLTHGDKYTISWLQWVDHLSKNAKAGLYTKNASGNSGFHDGQANSASSYNTKLRTWQRVYQTYTTSSVRDLSHALASIYMYGHHNVRATLKIADVQIDLLDHPTSYQEFTGSTTERSSTQGLLDLAGNITLDTNEVSFDEHGFPAFDGTNDKIDIGNIDAVRLGRNFTIECVVKPEQDKWMYFFHKGYGNNNSLAWGRHSSNDNWFFSTMIGGSYQNSYMGTATLDKFCHLVATYDGANLRLYENGILKVTSAKTHDMMTSGSPLGIGGPDRYWNGKIPVTKLYSKVLSAEDVKQNYNAYKNRFNI